MALATRSIERSGTRGEVYLSDPWEATAAVHNAGYPHLHLLGDWHSHTIPGSELPSLQDAKAWAGTMDSLARDAYVSLLVSPSEELGWMTPKFQPGSQGAMAYPRGPWSDGLTSTDGESPAPAEARAHAAPRPVDDGGGDRDVHAGSGCRTVERGQWLRLDSAVFAACRERFAVRLSDLARERARQGESG